jgi:YVTN family beta-propeller protein
MKGLHIRLAMPVAVLCLIAPQLIASVGTDGGYLLVLSKSENTLAIIDPSTFKILTRVPTGEAPHELTVSADGRLAFVCNYGTAERPGNTISIIDLRAGKETKRVHLGALLHPHGVTESKGGIYLTIEGSSAVARYDPVGDRIDWIMGTGQGGTHMVVVAPRSGTVYTANRDSNTISAIAPSSSAGCPACARTWKVSHIAVGKAPEGIDLSPDEREVWTAHRVDGGLSIIDTGTGQVKEVLQVGGSPIRVKFTPDGKRVLVSAAQTGDIVVFEAATRKLLRRIQIGGVPAGILVQPDGRRAFVASTQANKVSVIDLENFSVIGTIEPGRGPDGMAWAK